ncbi:MAG: hypothetical protein FWC16_11255 [Defluviitaleaceae bacterium]|nr:hypothetical protein [Defluviitaleaceae bacterium]MCL2275495.1 hypothetical protein [Defluviitaleaceae bacterium]
MTTRSLLNRLFKTASIHSYFKRFEAQMQSSTFVEHLHELCAAKNCKPAHVILKSGLYRTLGHQLFNGFRKPTRDKVIQLAFGFELDYAQSQQLLKKAKKSLLCPRIKRDALIIFTISRRHTFLETQDMLHEQGLPLLGERK